MLLVMLIQAEIFPHLYALNNGHPRSVIIASLGCGLPCFKNDKQGLESAQPRSVHKRVGVLCRIVSNTDKYKQEGSILEARANH